MTNDLQQYRDHIDRIDDQIIQLLAERQADVKAIGELKKAEGMSVYDPKRELSIRTRRKDLSKKLGIDPLRIDVIFDQILTLSRDTQQDMQGDLPAGEAGKDLGLGNELVKIGVMGGVGSFSEQAALYFAKNQNLENSEIYYPISAENVLKSLKQGNIDLGIFPIENSTAGIVMESIQAASQYTFEIVEIFQIDIVHCLHVLPGVKKEDIQKVMSHPQALKQCKGYLKSTFPNAELIEATDTAEGARILEQSPEETHLAVIAPKHAGEIYHLELLEEGIQDLNVNYTRFIAAKTG